MPASFARGDVGEDHEGDEDEDGGDDAGGDDAALYHCEVWTRWFDFVVLDWGREWSLG